MTTIEKKKVLLEQIQEARNKFKIDFNNGIITEAEIMRLLKVKSDFGFKYRTTVHTYKSNVLRSIFNSPFVLCDQDDLSIIMKKILPFLLGARYEMEIEELDGQLRLGYISNNEYIKKKQLLKFCYYESSEEGKSILKTGHVKNVLNNKIRVK